MAVGMTITPQRGYVAKLFTEDKNTVAGGDRMVRTIQGTRKSWSYSSDTYEDSGRHPYTCSRCRRLWRVLSPLRYGRWRQKHPWRFSYPNLPLVLSLWESYRRFTQSFTGPILPYIVTTDDLAGGKMSTGISVLLALVNI